MMLDSGCARAHTGAMTTTPNARTIPARGSIAALFVLADRALHAHTERNSMRVALGRQPIVAVERAALLARRDALADAYRCVIADELGVQFMLLDLPGLRDHAQQTVAARIGAL